MRKLTLEELQKRVDEVFGEGELKVIKRTGEKLSYLIVRDRYGEMRITADNLLRGRMPSIQSAVNKTKYFIETTKPVHGDRYDYSNSIYINSRTKILIFCKKHGEFTMSPSNHLNGKGCPKCGTELIVKKISLTRDEFIKRAKIIHGNRYFYDKSAYIKTLEKVTITCKKHGDFSMAPNNHINGRQGCPKCNKIGIPKSRKDCRKGFVYIVRCWNKNEMFYKVGFTKHSVEKRYGKAMNSDAMPYEYVSIFKMFFDEAEWIETSFHKENIDKRYFPSKRFGGRWECYKNDPTEVLKKHIAKILEDKDGKQKETRTVS